MRSLDTRSDARGPTASAGRAAIRDARFIAEWARVRIGQVQTVPAEAGAEPRTTVRACVHLGVLAPADVMAELLAADPGASKAHAMPFRLWSMQSYHNDSYDFETQVPTRLLSEPPGCVIRVSPVADLTNGMTMQPVVRPVSLARP